MSTYAQVGTLSQGEEFVVLEEELNDEGAMMVRFSKGWVPMATGDKAEILVPTSMLNTVADASYEIVLDEVEWEEVESDNTVIWLRTGNWKMEERMKQEEEQLQEQETAAGAHEGEGGAAAESNPAAEPEPLPLEEAPAAEAVAAKDGPIACYRVVKKATLRAEFDVKSSQTGSAKKNEILPVFEERDEDEDPYGFGLKRVRCELGWVSVMSKDGSAILQAMDLEEGLKLIAEGANDAAEEALAEPEPEVSAAGPVVAKLDIAADDENPQRKSINDMFAQKIISEEERDDMLAKMDRQEEQARAEKEQSSLWTEAVGIFNKKGSKKGVAFIRDKWDALFPVKDGEDSQKYGPEPTAQAIARVLKEAAGLDNREIGEFLGGGKDLNIQVRKYYARTFNFLGMTFVASLRQYLSGFRLPGESMLIERIMSDFSVQFYLDNPEFVLHLSPENIEKFRARYDECGASGTLLATKLIETVKGLDGEFKYMKNTEIAEMFEIEISEVVRMKDLGIEVKDEGAIATMMRDVMLGCTVAIAEDDVEKAGKKYEDSVADAARAAQELSDAGEAAPEEIERLTSRLDHNKAEKVKKHDLSKKAQEDLVAITERATTVADATVDIAYFLAVLARKMGTDTAFVLAYSTIQLNTDAHSPKLVERMSKEQFLENNKLAPDLAALPDTFMAQLYDEITGEEIKILDDGGEMVEVPIAPSPRSRRRTMGSPKSINIVPAFDKLKLKKYDVQQSGIKKAPKKVQIIVSQMGISVMDAQGRPVTNILFMMLTKWDADPKGLLIERKAKGDKDIRFRTGEAAEISEEMNLAKAAIDKAAEEKSTTAADTADIVGKAGGKVGWQVLPA